MKKNYSLSAFRVFLLSLLIFISACGIPESTQLPTPATPTLIATGYQPALSPQASTPEPVASPVMINEARESEIEILPTSFEQSGEWNLQHPYADPNAPSLITLALDGFRLDPDFQVKSIELSYDWMGLVERSADYQRIERRGDGFWQDDLPVSAEAVRNLIQSISHLRLEAEKLSVITHTDDYPRWAIELTDTNGHKVLLFSDSNTPNFVPWSVIYNGQVYAQFDGAIPIALFDLFTVTQGISTASTWGPQEEEYLNANTLEGPAPQLSGGFSGLLPVYRGFSYSADRQKGVVTGHLSSLSDSDLQGETEIDWFNDLQKIELGIGDNLTVDCDLESVPQNYPGAVGCHFTCPLGKTQGSISYQFPITLTFASSSNQAYTLPGTLFGYWDPQLILPSVAYAEEIGEILESSPLSGDLLRDHVMEARYTNALADPKTGLLDHQWEADVVLFGQVQAGEKIIPYSVMLNEVKIEDGKLVHWDLDRSELITLLQDVLDQSVTQRYLETVPDPVLNLYYAEAYEHPIFTARDLPRCAYLPEVKELPQANQPLRGFSFDLPHPYSAGFLAMQVVLMENGLRIQHLSLQPSITKDAFWVSMLPDSLKPQGAAPFTDIITRVGEPGLTIKWAENVSIADLNYYYAMFAGWEVDRETIDSGIILMNRTFDIAHDGQLILVDCNTP